MKYLSFALCSTSCFLSCGKGGDAEVETRITSNGQRIKVSKNAVVRLDPALLNVRDGKPISKKIVLDTLYGGLMTWESDTWLKVVFSDAVTGLKANKEYYARPALCTQELETAGHNEFKPYYKGMHMGVWPSFAVGEMGCEIVLVSEKKARCKTKLLYVGYDENLREVDQYYPIHPNKLIWYVYKKSYDWGL